MQGHEPIIAMRRKGRAPGVVFINDFPCKTSRDWHICGDHATVSVHEEVIQLLDLRFLVGLRVSINGSTEVRAKALFEKAKASGARVVGAVHACRHNGIVKSGWCEVWKKEQESA